MQARQRDGRTPASADDRGGSLRGMLGARPSQRSESLRERSADLSKGESLQEYQVHRFVDVTEPSLGGLFHVP